MPNSPPLTYISVDIETAGPNPSDYSLLAIGACLVKDPHIDFYVEIQPVNKKITDEALSVHRLSLVELAARGVSPTEAMARFADWINSLTAENGKALFVAFNAPFDWMFVNDYFHRYLGYNPFGYAALDIKAYYMGLMGVSWQQTGMQKIARSFLKDRQLSHHALQDAKDQAEIFQHLLDYK